MERVSVTINGNPFQADIDERTLLIEFLRDEAGLTGTHAGCWEARCGCCAVLVDGGAVKSCNVLALQVDGSAILTVEGLAEDELTPGDGGGFLEAREIDLELLHPLQTAFRKHGAVQCGFCTPGMLMVLIDFLRRIPTPARRTSARPSAATFAAAPATRRSSRRRSRRPPQVQAAR